MIRRIMVLLIAGILFSSMGAPEAPSWTGKLSVVGNEPFTSLALTDREGRQWYLTGEPAKELRQTGQGRWVKVEGKLVPPQTIEVSRWTWAAEDGKRS